jgi:hypothetical protein
MLEIIREKKGGRRMKKGRREKKRKTEKKPHLLTTHLSI